MELKIKSQQDTLLELEEKIYGAYDAFLSILPFAYKVDLWRYCLLYFYNGVYADHEVQFKLKLKKIVSMFTTYKGSQKMFVCYDRNTSKGIAKKLWNGFLISTEQYNPYWLLAIQFCISNIQAQLYNDILDITGPGLLRQVVNIVVQSQLQELDRFQPVFVMLCSRAGAHHSRLETMFEGDIEFATLDGEGHHDQYGTAFREHRVYNLTHYKIMEQRKKEEI